MKNAEIEFRCGAGHFWKAKRIAGVIPELCAREVKQYFEVPRRQFTAVFHEHPRTDGNDFRIKRPILTGVCSFARATRLVPHSGLDGGDNYIFLMSSVRQVLAHFYKQGYRYVHVEYNA